MEKILNLPGWKTYIKKSHGDDFLNQINPAQTARVTSVHTGIYTLLIGGMNCTKTAKLSGKLKHNGGAVPVVGDFVKITDRKDFENAVIDDILPRFSEFSRGKAAVKKKRQVVAANIDYVFIVNALDSDRGFNINRLRRFITIAETLSIIPVIIFNKTDITENLSEAEKEVRHIWPAYDIIKTSALNHEGIAPVFDFLKDDKTAVMTGLSGVGKTTLLNALTSRVEAVGEVREHDARGRHTTTRRELFLMPDGGCIIDTPGIRDIAMTAKPREIKNIFSDIEELAKKCKFNDCAHQQEPGCQIQQALKSGELNENRYRQYLAFSTEAEEQVLRESIGKKRFKKQKWAETSRKIKAYKKSLK